MLDDNAISLLCLRKNNGEFTSDKNLLTLLTKWEEVKTSPSISIKKYDRESLGIIISYFDASDDGRYDYRKDCWFAFSGTADNMLYADILDSFDMAHDAALLADDIRETLGLSFLSFSDIPQIKHKLYTIVFSPLINLVFLTKDELFNFIKNVSELEKLSFEIRKKRNEITANYSHDIFKLDKTFWDGELTREGKRKIEALKRTKEKITPDEFNAITRNMNEYRELKRLYSQKEDETGNIKSGIYEKWRTDWKRYSEALSDIVNLHINGLINKKYDINNLDTFQKEVELLYKRMCDIEEKYSSSFERLSQKWDKSIVDLTSLPFKKFISLFSNATIDDTLKYRWKNVLDIIISARSNGVIEAIDDSLSLSLRKDEAVSSFKKALCTIGISELVKDLPIEEKKEETGGELFPLYSECDISLMAKKMDVESFSSPSFPLLMKSVIDKEAPLYKRDLLKRIIFLFDGDDTITKEKMEKGGEALSALDGTILSIKGDFVYSIDKRDYLFRRSLFMRDFSHIAQEEIAEGLYEIIKEKGKIERRELYDTLGRLCGYNRVLKARYPELDSCLALVGGIEITGDEISFSGGK